MWKTKNDGWFLRYFCSLLCVGVSNYIYFWYKWCISPRSFICTNSCFRDWRSYSAVITQNVCVCVCACAHISRHLATCVCACTHTHILEYNSPTRPPHIVGAGANERSHRDTPTSRFFFVCDWTSLPIVMGKNVSKIELYFLFSFMSLQTSTSGPDPQNLGQQFSSGRKKKHPTY